MCYNLDRQNKSVETRDELDMACKSQKYRKLLKQRGIDFLNRVIQKTICEKIVCRNSSETMGLDEFLQRLEANRKPDHYYKL